MSEMNAIKVLRHYAGATTLRANMHDTQRDACEALARLARLVEAAKALLVVRAGPTPADASPYYRAVTELNDALSAVLGEGE